MRRQTEIEDEAVNITPANLPHDLCRRREVRLPDFYSRAESLQALAGCCERLFVAIEAEKLAVRAAFHQNGFRVPSTSQSTVQIAPAGLGPKQLDDLPDHDGNMRELHRGSRFNV